MSTTYIKLSGGYRQYCEANAVAFDLDSNADLPEGIDAGDWKIEPAYALRKGMDSIRWYQSGTVACEPEDADTLRAALNEMGIGIEKEYAAYACTGSQGDVIHTVRKD